MSLLERDAQLLRLETALEEARQGMGATVLVSGEAGIGKSSLLQAFADRAGATARVLAGACEDLLTPRPLGPFRDMARDAGGLAGLAGDDRDAFLDALLAEMSFTQRPAVVIVEDGHWADAASLDIIRYLARRIDRLAALLVVSYRDEELGDDHPFARMVAALAGPSVLRIELEGLSDEAVAELATAAGLDPGPVVAAVGGNPFYLTEVLAAPGAAVPPSVRHAVRARFSSLPASCRSSLERLAVVPSGVEPWLVRSLVEDPAVLEPAERRGMLVAAQGRVRFRHELARRAVELSLPSTRRMDHHRRVLAALAVGGAEPSPLVHHAVAAADEQAVARPAGRVRQRPRRRGRLRPAGDLRGRQRGRRPGRDRLAGTGQRGRGDPAGRVGCAGDPHLDRSVTVEITKTTPSQARDYTAISELAFEGATA